MSTNTRRALFWAPRILSILFALFLSLFALDVFGEGYSFWETILALLIHLIPVYIIVIVLAVAWRWEWVGAVLFPALGIFYIVWMSGRFPVVTYVSMSGPLFLIGVLFLLDWIYREELRTRVDAPSSHS